jgi:hypothetical protein
VDKESGLSKVYFKKIVFRGRPILHPHLVLPSRKGDTTEMEDAQQQQQQQQQQPLHRAAAEGIERLADPRYRDERRKLYVDGLDDDLHVDQRSLQHLVDFLITSTLMTSQ